MLGKRQCLRGRHKVMPWAKQDKDFKNQTLTDLRLPPRSCLGERHTGHNGPDGSRGVQLLSCWGSALSSPLTLETMRSSPYQFQHSRACHKRGLELILLLQAWTSPSFRHCLPIAFPCVNLTRMARILSVSLSGSPPPLVLTAAYVVGASYLGALTHSG